MARREVDDDPIVRALERSTIAQTLKAARASLAEPSRPFTPLDRSLFQLPDAGGAHRPTSSYSVDQLAFVRDTYGGRPESARSSRSSRSRAGRPETIAEEGGEGGFRRDCGADILNLEDEDGLPVRHSPLDSEVGDVGGSSDEEATPMASSPGGCRATVPSPPPTCTPTKPPRPPGGGYPSPVTATLRSPGSLAEAAEQSQPHRSQSTGQLPLRRRSSEESPRRRKASMSPSPGGGAACSSTAPATPDASCEAVIEKLRALASSKEKRKKHADLLLKLCAQSWDLAMDIQAGKGATRQLAPQLLRQVMGLMDLKDLKDAKCLFKLSRSALALLQMEVATQGVPASGVQAAYVNIAQVLFKFSQAEGHDGDFLAEQLFDPLLEVLQSSAPACASADLRVYIVGVLKNASYEDANQKYLVQQGAIPVLFQLMGSDNLAGNSKEAQLLIQITATLRNLAAGHYKQLLPEERLNTLTRVMSLFPNNVELLTNISRLLSKLTLHASACEAIAKTDAHIRQIARIFSAHADVAPLTLRLAFVLGNLTERSDRLRVVFAFDCEGTSLVPQLLGKYWQKERQLLRVDPEAAKTKASVQEIEEVLVKLVRLLANIAISASAGAILASSSAVADPLLDMLGAKRIGDSEELVLNVVAAVTNLLFYDVPSNLLFQEENKRLLCRLFRPLLLESYNVEALIETARALGNLSRHTDARKSMAALRIDEILVILLDHDDRDLVFYVCGALVNLGADPDCTARLVESCPVTQKLAKLLTDAPADDAALQLVAVKVLTNLSLDPSVGWAGADLEGIRSALEQSIQRGESAFAVSSVSEPADPERPQLLDLTRHLLGRLPPSVATTLAERAERAKRAELGEQLDSGATWVYCPADGCGRRFISEDKLVAHMERRHPCRR